MERIELVKGDITDLDVDAIVNAANKSLKGGGGVDGAIHRAAGPQLLEECKQLGGCPTGDAKITGGYKLPADYVIHAVGPRWQGGDSNENQLLSKCYEKSLKLANQHNLKTIAFPNISTGVYGFPKERAANIAIKTVRDYLADDDEIRKVIFCVFDEENQRIYASKLKEK